MALTPLQNRYARLASEYASLAAAVAAIGSTPWTLILDAEWTDTLTGNLTIPATLHLKPQGGVIDIDGFTLTINSAFRSPRIQVFDVSTAGSAVVFGKSKVVAPEWYGAVANGSTDCTNAIVVADASAVNATVSFGDGTYRTTAQIDITHRLRWIGAGIHSTTLHLDSATLGAVNIDGTGAGGISGVVLRDMMIYCGAGTSRTAGFGLSMTFVANYRLQNLAIRHGWDGLLLDESDSGVIDHVVIDGTPAIASTGDGLNRGCIIARCISTDIQRLVISSTGDYTHGLVVEGGCDTVILDHVEIGGACQFPVTFQNTVGGGAHDPRWVRGSDILLEARDADGIGLRVVKGIDVEIRGLYTKGGINGLNVNGGKVVKFIGGSVQLAQEHGCVVDACDELEFHGTTFSDNGQDAADTYSGLTFAPGVGNFRLYGVRSGNIIWNGSGGYTVSQRHGINLIAAAGDNFTILGCDTRGNITSGLVAPAATATKVIADNR